MRKIRLLSYASKDFLEGVEGFTVSLPRGSPEGRDLRVRGKDHGSPSNCKNPTMPIIKPEFEFSIRGE